MRDAFIISAKLRSELAAQTAAPRKRLKRVIGKRVKMSAAQKKDEHRLSGAARPIISFIIAESCPFKRLRTGNPLSIYESTADERVFLAGRSCEFRFKNGI